MAFVKQRFPLLMSPLGTIAGAANSDSTPSSACASVFLTELPGTLLTKSGRWMYSLMGEPGDGRAEDEADEGEPLGDLRRSAHDFFCCGGKRVAAVGAGGEGDASSSVVVVVVGESGVRIGDEWEEDAAVAVVWPELESAATVGVARGGDEDVDAAGVEDSVLG